MRRLILSLLLVSAAFPAGLDDPSWTPPPNRPGLSAWIPLRHQDQEYDLCMPTSASMVLDYFGDSLAPREIKALTRGKEYKPGDIFKDFSGTDDHDLVAALARRGYRWRVKDYRIDAGGLQAGLADFERSLDAGIPATADCWARFRDLGGGLPFDQDGSGIALDQRRLAHAVEARLQPAAYRPWLASPPRSTNAHR